MAQRIITFRVPDKLAARLDRVTKKKPNGHAPPTVTYLVLQGLNQVLARIERRRRTKRGK